MFLEAVRHTFAQIAGDIGLAVKREMQAGVIMGIRAQVVDAAHVIVVAVGEQSAGQVGTPYPEQLLAEVGAAVDEYGRSAGLCTE